MPRQRLITADDLLKFNWLGDAQMSPEGTHIAFVRKTVGARNAYETSIWIVPVPADTSQQRDTARGASKRMGSPTAVTSGPKDSMPRFLPGRNAIVFARAHKKNPTQLVMASSKRLAKVRPLTNLPEGTIGAISVSPDGRMIAYSFRATGYNRTKAAAADRAKSGASTPALVVADPWYRLDGDGVFGPDRFRLRVFDLATGRDREVYAQDTLGTFSFDFSPNGTTLAISTNRHPRALLDSWRDEIVLLDVTAAIGSPASVRALRGLPIGPKTSVRFSPDGSRVAYAGRLGRDGLYSTDNLSLWVHDLRSAATRCLTSGTDYCLMAASLSDSAEPSFGASFLWMPDGQSLLAEIGWHGEGHIASIDASPKANPGKGASKRALPSAVAFHSFGAAEHWLGGVSRNGSVLALLRATPTELPEIHVARIEGMEFPVSRLTHFNDALLGGLELAVPVSRWIKSSDGTSVQCWCMRPPPSALALTKSARSGSKAANTLSQHSSTRTPAIIEVHGGPHAQYGSAFFHEFQFLAAAGYTVFYSNPRGSKGYGRDFCAAIRGAWGTADWRDVEAVTRFVRKQRGVDPARVGIMGGSYGGYMANWAVCHSRAYRAAITDRCVSNVVSHCGSSDFPEVPNTYWRGSAFRDARAMWDSSPIAHFKNARTPMLIIHSEGDLRCNIEQSEQIHAALVVQDVPVRFVRYPRETSHGLSRAGPPDLRLHRLGEIRQWWHKWMK